MRTLLNLMAIGALIGAQIGCGEFKSQNGSEELNSVANDFIGNTRIFEEADCEKNPNSVECRKERDPIDDLPKEYTCGFNLYVGGMTVDFGPFPVSGITNCKQILTTYLYEKCAYYGGQVDQYSVYVKDKSGRIFYQKPKTTVDCKDYGFDPDANYMCEYSIYKKDSTDTVGPKGISKISNCSELVNIELYKLCPTVDVQFYSFVVKNRTFNVVSRKPKTRVNCANYQKTIVRCDWTVDSKYGHSSSESLCFEQVGIARDQLCTADPNLIEVNWAVLFHYSDGSTAEANGTKKCTRDPGDSGGDSGGDDPGNGDNGDNGGDDPGNGDNGGDNGEVLEPEQSKCNVTIKRGTKVIAEIGPIQSLTNDQCRHEQNKMFDDICMELAGEAAQSSSPVTVHGRWRNELGDISLGSGFEPRQCLADGTHKCPAGYFKDSKGRCVSLI